MKLRVRVWDKRAKKMYPPEKIARLHFDEGDIYAALTLHEGAIFHNDLVVMVSTGIKDMKDREIFEGDIVINAQNKLKYGVEWSEINAWWCMVQVRDETTPYTGGINGQDIHRCKVVGNMYENPEMLKCPKK